MDDFEKCEAELNHLYGDYVLKFRILSYLEKELEGHFRSQREKVQVCVNLVVEHISFISVCFCLHLTMFSKCLDNICSQ